MILVENFNCWNCEKEGPHQRKAYQNTCLQENLKPWELKQVRFLNLVQGIGHLICRGWQIHLIILWLLDLDIEQHFWSIYWKLRRTERKRILLLLSSSSHFGTRSLQTILDCFGESKHDRLDGSKINSKNSFFSVALPRIDSSNLWISGFVIVIVWLLSKKNLPAWTEEMEEVEEVGTCCIPGCRREILSPDSYFRCNESSCGAVMCVNCILDEETHPHKMTKVRGIIQGFIFL